ncbi:MAG: ATP-binding cassette domain-containing protein [bacterium]
MYKLTGIKKTFGGVPALNIPSLRLNEGRFYVIYGPNGAGKTTLLNLLSFLDYPDEGEIIPGSGNCGCPQGVPWDRRDVTMVMQNPYYFRGTVKKNVSIGLVFRSVKKSGIEEIIKPVMEEFGIWDLRDRNINLLSAGEKKRVAIVRALVLNTKIILLDEVTSNVDKIHADIIEEALLKLVGLAGKTVVMTTHDLSQAYRMTENVIFLVKGSVSDSPLWNVYKVNLSGEAGVKKALTRSGAEIYVATRKTGPASISVGPRNIIVSRHAVSSSALNNLKGKVVSIAERNGIIDIVVDVRVKLHVFITRKSLRDMHLEVGEEIFVVFKAAAVEVM